MNEQEIIAEFEAAQAILRGHFILSSGLHSATYLQCARVLMDAARASRLCAELAARVTKAGIKADIVVSPAMGGVVVGYEMGRQLKLSAVFCEREEGKFTLRRGFHLEKGMKVLVVEDVVTTGKSSREAFDCVRGYGAEVVAEAALIDRSRGESNLGVPLFTLLQLDIPTYAEHALPPELANVPAVKPGSRFLKSA